MQFQTVAGTLRCPSTVLTIVFLHMWQTQNLQRFMFAGAFVFSVVFPGISSAVGTHEELVDSHDVNCYLEGKFFAYSLGIPLPIPTGHSGKAKRRHRYLRNLMLTLS